MKIGKTITTVTSPPRRVYKAGEPRPDPRIKPIPVDIPKRVPERIPEKVPA